MKPALTLLALALSSAVFAQTPPNTVKFAAADISLRVRTGTTNQPAMTGGVLRGGRYDLRNATMLDLIATAYAISDRDLIVGGPAWLERNRCGGLSLFDAVERQLGLKLENRKRPMRVLVIDSIQEKPID